MTKISALPTLAGVPSELKIPATVGGITYQLSKGQILAPGDISGFMDYNDTTGDVAMTADTWTDVPNNGAGAFTNKTYPPTGVSELLDVATGKIDPTELDLGDSMFVRLDLTVNPTINNSRLEIQFTLGGSGDEYTLPVDTARLDDGSGKGYRFARLFKIYMGDANTRDNPIGLQVKCSSAATLNNAGVAITVVNR